MITDIFVDDTEGTVTVAPDTYSASDFLYSRLKMGTIVSTQSM